ncbi:MAG: phage major capsid protein [Acidobacteriota bacterium]
MDVMDGLMERAQKDGRDLTRDEIKEFDKAEREFRHLSSQIEEAESRCRRAIAGEGGGGGYLEGCRSASGPFHSIGEFFQAVAQAATPGQAVDQRLHDIREARALGLSEAIGSEGGFLVQTDFSTMLLDRAFAGSKVVSLATRIPVKQGANSVELPAIDETSRKEGYRTGGITSYWLSEGGTKVPSKPIFRKIVLAPKKLIGLTYASDELLEDADALGLFLTRAFTSEFAFKLDDAAIRGNGASEPLGILNAPCTIVQIKEVGQAAGSLTYANICSMWSRGLNPETATWFVSKSVLPALYQLSIVGGISQQPVFVPQGGASQRPYDALFGRQVVVIEQASPLGTKGDIILASMDRYLIAQKGGLQSAQSIFVAFTTDQTCFRFVLRVDMAAELTSAITPAQGSVTESSFVCLETR